MLATTNIILDTRPEPPQAGPTTRTPPYRHAMNDLWASKRLAARQSALPLASRMRPRTLEEFGGQEHILGEGKLLRRMLKSGAITSVLLYGPPGTGKTTLAELVAKHSSRYFERENASTVGVKRIREIIDEATKRLELEGRRTILFLDEIHRFTKSQQDVLLGDVERGLLTLIGATTENPLFAVNSALVSRSTLFRLEPLSIDAVKDLLRKAISDPERGYGKLSITADEAALDLWATKCDGDARRALTALEVAVLSSIVPNVEPTPPIALTLEVAQDSIQQKAVVYDGTGDDHYDTISAFIKSVRGNDPDAAIYWLAKMLEAGEDPRFIARRLAILASEDIGNADPRAIMVAQSAWELTERLGMPECRITLAQCTTYLALAPKSNASYLAIDEAIQDVREGRTVAVPMVIKDGNVRKATTLSGEYKDGDKRAESYQYAHDAADGITAQDYLGVSKSYYRPNERGFEKTLKEQLEFVKQRRDQLRNADGARER